MEIWFLTLRYPLALAFAAWIKLLIASKNPMVSLLSNHFKKADGVFKKADGV